MPRLHLLFLISIIILLAACVPAKTPPQLDNTPGAFVTLDETAYRTDTFAANYPEGWRVVKLSEAGASHRVAFVSPDDAQVITLIEGELTDWNSGAETRSILDSVTLADGKVITVIGEASESLWNDFEPIFEQVLASVRQ